MPFRIGIDAHGVGGIGLAAGNETFISNLLKKLQIIDEENDYTVFVSKSDVFDTLNHSNFKTIKLFSNTQWIQRGISLPLYLLKNRLDLIHVSSVLPPYCPAKSIITLHDIFHEEYEELYTPLEYKRMKTLIPINAKKADKIITVSNYSKQQIIKHYNITEDKIDVIYNSVDKNTFRILGNREETQNYIRSNYGINDEFILYVGTLQPRKNVERLLNAYFELKKDGGALPKLVIVGKKGWKYKQIFDRISEFGLERDVIFTGYVPLTDLVYFYNGALLFVFPSIAEGFGIPPLEAMACGTPVICSNTTCFPEIVGDSAMLINPFDSNDIYSALKNAINKKEIREKYISRGLVQIEKFSWYRSALKLHHIYKEVLDTIHS